MKNKNRGSIIAIIIIMIVSISTPQIICTLDSEDEEDLSLGAPLGLPKSSSESSVNISITCKKSQLDFKFLNKKTGEEFRDEGIGEEVDIRSISHKGIMEEKDRIEMEIDTFFYIDFENYSIIELEAHNIGLKEIRLFDPLPTGEIIGSCTLEIFETSSNKKILYCDNYDVNKSSGTIKFNIEEKDLISEDIPIKEEYRACIRYKKEIVSNHIKDIDDRKLYGFTVWFLYPKENHSFEFRSEPENLLFEYSDVGTEEYRKLISGTVNELEQQGSCFPLKIEYSNKMKPTEEARKEFPKNLINYIIFGIVAFILGILLRPLVNKIKKGTKKNNI